MDPAPSTQGRGWAKPGVVLALFCTVNFIVYCDRGACKTGSERILEGSWNLSCFRLVTKVLCLRHLSVDQFESQHNCLCHLGIISSNGVNGARTVDGKPGHGIQARFFFWFSEVPWKGHRCKRCCKRQIERLKSCELITTWDSFSACLCYRSPCWL